MLGKGCQGCIPGSTDFFDRSSSGPSRLRWLHMRLHRGHVGEAFTMETLITGPPPSHPKDTPASQQGLLEAVAPNQEVGESLRVGR